jgi:hypothetical protein
MTGLPKQAHRTCTTFRFVPEPTRMRSRSKFLLAACREMRRAVS